MNTEGLQATEAECAAGRTAPRVSLSDIEANIAGEFFNTADQMFPGAPVLAGMDLLTVCILVLKNGFTIIGKSAPASRDNFDPVLGQKLAYEDAVRQVWPLMGYALRQKLHEAIMPEVGEQSPLLASANAAASVASSQPTSISGSSDARCTRMHCLELANQPQQATDVIVQRATSFVEFVDG